QLVFACLLGLVAATASAADAPQTIEQIETCIRGNIPSDLQIREFQMVATDKTGGQRTLGGRVYAKLEDNLLMAMMRVEAPSDMRGASYLIREGKEGKEEEMYVYIPALQKVRRISGGMKESSLFGTDLSYSDLKQITYAFSGGKMVLEKTEPYESRPSWVVSMKPESQEASRFDTVRAWIDQKSCMLMKAEFLQEGAARKRFTSSPKFLAQSGPHWYITEGKMEDLQEKTNTQLKIVGLSSKTDLADRLFNPRMFYLGN
ncbi:MAG TPA: outer membrane lipoprotein-sorting protein, partial [Nevskiaceae bacterium]|nr:outer membrane lipoprotein-sorting protein [Nevskiaceae bacterium]